MIVAPSNSRLGLFHDDITVSRNLLQPISTFFALAGLMGLLGAVLWGIRRAPLLAFGILFFLAGHILESTIFNLELSFEHRNYLPSYGLALMVIYYLLHPSISLLTLKTRGSITIVLLIMLAAVTWMRADAWGSPLKFATLEVINHPQSPRADASPRFR